MDGSILLDQSVSELARASSDISADPAIDAVNGRMIVAIELKTTELRLQELYAACEQSSTSTVVRT